MAPPPDPVGKNIEEAMKTEMQKQCGPGMEIPNNDLSPSKKQQVRMSRIKQYSPEKIHKGCPLRQGGGVCPIARVHCFAYFVSR